MPTPIIASRRPANALLSEWRLHDLGQTNAKVYRGSKNCTTHVPDQLIWLRASTTMRWAGNIRRLRTFGNDFAATNGTYNFHLRSTALRQRRPTTGNCSSAIFLSVLWIVRVQRHPRSFRSRSDPVYHAGFFQDHLRVTRTLLLDYVFATRCLRLHPWSATTASWISTSPILGANNLPGALNPLWRRRPAALDHRPYPTISAISVRAVDSLFLMYVSLKTVIRSVSASFNKPWARWLRFSRTGSMGATPARPHQSGSTGDHGGSSPPHFHAPPSGGTPHLTFQTAASIIWDRTNGKAPAHLQLEPTIQREYSNWLFEQHTLASAVTG